MSSVLDVDRLAVSFGTGTDTVHAVRDVSFSVRPGERIGIVGESGSGKSITAQAVMRLLPADARVSGGIRFDDEDVRGYDRRRLACWRGAQVSMVFQDPMSSLNPLVRVARQITETLRRHRGLSRAEAYDEAVRLLRTVGVADADRRIHDYPHAFSGGMRQRVCIAIAASCTPRLIIADEPTTALDVTVQAQVLDLLDELADDHDSAVLLISHDLGVVSSFCDRILIMYAGRIVESGPTDQIVAHPDHPYTRALLDAIPSLVGPLPDRLPAIGGSPPTGGATDGRACAFADRCPRVQPRCRREPPTPAASGSRSVACHFPLDHADATVDPDPEGGRS